MKWSVSEGSVPSASARLFWASGLIVWFLGPADPTDIGRWGSRWGANSSSSPLTPEQVMEEMDWSRSKVSKVETANMGVSVSDVRVLCDLYRAEPAVAEWLAKTARDARRRGWWDAYNDATPSSFEDYVELESEATTAHYFEIDLIPGLLQTKDYALALMETTAPGAPAATIQARAELRMRRQERLRDGELSLWAIIDEVAEACFKSRLTLGGPPREMHAAGQEGQESISINGEDAKHMRELLIEIAP